MKIILTIITESKSNYREHGRRIMMAQCSLAFVEMHLLMMSYQLSILYVMKTNDGVNNK